MEPSPAHESKSLWNWGLVLALVVLAALAWFTCRGQSSPEPVPAPPADSPASLDASIPGAEPVAESPAQRSAAEAPVPPSAIAPAEPMLHGTLRVVDGSGAPVKGAKVALTIVPHDPTQACAGRALAACDEEGKTQVEFTPGEALRGFALSQEQEREHLAALAQGYRRMPPGESPADADTCSLRLELNPAGYRALDTHFDFSIRAALAAEGRFSCELCVFALPHAPMLHLTVIDALTKAPIRDAIVKFKPARQGGEWVYGLTDGSGRAQQTIGMRLAMDGTRLEDSPDPATLPRSEGIPLEMETPGPVVRVTVEHFPEYAPGFYWFHVTEAYIAQSDVYETVELRPRQYLSLRLVDSSTGQAIASADSRAEICFYSAHPLEVMKAHGWMEFETAQKYPLSESPVRIALDGQGPSGMVVRVETQRKGANYQASYFPHFVTAQELQASPLELTVNLNPLRPFYLFLHDLDQPDQPVITDVSVVLHTKYTSDQLGPREVIKNHTQDLKLDESPNRISFPGYPGPPLGAIKLFWGWSPMNPDLQSLSIERLSLIGTDLAAYEILGPDMQVLAPWSDAESRGTFARPLFFMSEGKPVIGDGQGFVNLYVRRKKP